MRDVGINDATCTKLVEEGVPSTTGPTAPAASLDAVGATLGSTPATGQSASTINASGYAKAWYENIVGQTLTSDTTYLTWAYNGSCVTTSSSSGYWTWNYGYGWSLVSNAGTRAQYCNYALGSTWSTFRNGSCYDYYSYVNTTGWYDGSFAAGRSDSATCGPVWEHFVYVRTT